MEEVVEKKKKKKKEKRPKSTKPGAIRKRVRKFHAKTEEIKGEIELLYQKPIEAWDFEELQRGRPRRPDGTFSRGPAPEWLTPVLQAEAQKRLKGVTRDQLGMLAGDAIQVMEDLMKGPKTPAIVRFQSAQYVLNQLIGLPTASVEISGGLELKAMFADVIVNPDGSEAHPVIEGAVAEEEEEDEPED